MKKMMIGMVMLIAFALRADPTTAPSDGFALTPQQMQDKLDALNQKAATRPTTDPIDWSLRKAQSKQISQLRQRYIGDAKSITAQGGADLAAIDKQLSDVRSRGRAAGAKLDQLRQQQTDTENAARVTHMHTDYIGGDGSFPEGSDTTITSEAAAQAAAARFDQPIKDATQAVQDLLDQQQKLTDQRAQVVAAIAEARKQNTVNTRNQINAVGYWAATRPAAQPTSQPAFVPPEAKP